MNSAGEGFGRSTASTGLTAVALTTALVGTAAGPDAIAGYGTGGRLEYLLVPLVFGLGAPLVALVGTNIGAGQRARALASAAATGDATAKEALAAFAQACHSRLRDLLCDETSSQPEVSAPAAL